MHSQTRPGSIWSASLVMFVKFWTSVSLLSYSELRLLIHEYHFKKQLGLKLYKLPVFLHNLLTTMKLKYPFGKFVFN